MEAADAGSAVITEGGLTAMEDENLVWEEISTEHIVRDEWIDFRKTA